MKVDHEKRYLDGLTIKVRRYIPSFAEVCQAQVNDPELFRESIFTRTFVVFKPGERERRFKLHTLEDIEGITKLERHHGFSTIPEKTYNNIHSTEYELDNNGIVNIRAPFDRVQHPILAELIPNYTERRRYLDAKFSEEEKISGKELPLVYIQKRVWHTKGYLSPLRVGTRSYYIAVGEDNIEQIISQKDHFTFLQIPRIEE